MQCAIRALSLQERYSLVAACNFIVRIILSRDTGSHHADAINNKVDADTPLISRRRPRNSAGQPSDCTWATADEGGAGRFRRCCSQKRCAKSDRNFGHAVDPGERRKACGRGIPVDERDSFECKDHIISNILYYLLLTL